MNRSYLAAIARAVPTDEDPRGFKLYGHLSVVATNKAEATALVERHLAEKKPLGFSEREIRRQNPKRTPWIPGLRILWVVGGESDSSGLPIGVESDDRRVTSDDIPF